MLSFQVKPKECYLKKYCNPKKREGLELQDIKKYGRQILEVDKRARWIQLDPVCELQKHTLTEMLSHL